MTWTWPCQGFSASGAHCHTLPSHVKAPAASTRRANRRQQNAAATVAAAVASVTVTALRSAGAPAQDKHHAVKLAAARLVHTNAKPRPRRSGTRWMCTGGAADMRSNDGTDDAQARRNTSVPLVPPKPKLFFTATSIFMSRAVLAQ